MKRLLVLSFVCTFSSLYTMEENLQPIKKPQEIRAVRIINIVTPIPNKQTNSDQELGALLRRPSKEFKKTDIVHVHLTDDGPRIIVNKRGTLDSLTADDINKIATGFACYHSCIKKLNKNAQDVTVGTIAIDEDMLASKKDDRYLAMEREAIVLDAVKRKMEKEKNKKNQKRPEILIKIDK